ALKDLQTMAKVGGVLNQMRQEDFYLLARLMTMSAGDFLHEGFGSGPLKGTKSTSGIIGTFLGPRSPGTGYVLLHHYLGEVDGVFRAWGFARGGTGALSQAIASAAREAGVEIKVNAPVAQVIIKDGAATGVALESGDEYVADVVVSNADAKRTFLKLVEAKHLPEEFVHDVKRYRI